MRGQFGKAEVWLAGLFPLALYGFLAIVAEGFYYSCCAGIPDHGQVPIQYLPDFLISYRPSSFSLWVISASAFALPGFVAGFISLSKLGHAVASVSLLAVFWHALDQVWEYHLSNTKFLADLNLYQWRVSYAVWPCAISVVVIVILLASGLLSGKWVQKRAKPR